MLKKVAKCYSPWLEIIPFGVVLFSIVYSVYYYGEIPDIIPKYFNAVGMPVDWTGRGILIFLPIVSLWLYLQNSLINYFLIIAPKDAGTVLRYSPEKREKLGGKRLEQIRTLVARLLWIVNSLVAILFAYIIHGIIKIALGYETVLGLGLWFIIGILIAAVVYICLKIIILSRIPKET